MLARSAGLELGETGGVRCDEGLRTSAARVWAAGDICEYASVMHGGRRIRVEHTEHAKAQGAFVARAILGAEEPYSRGAVLLQRPRRLGLARVRRARRTPGTRRSSPARWRTGSSASGTSSTATCAAR